MVRQDQQSRHKVDALTRAIAVHEHSLASVVQVCECGQCRGVVNVGTLVIRWVKTLAVRAAATLYSRDRRALLTSEDRYKKKRLRAISCGGSGWLAGSGSIELRTVSLSDMM